MDLSVFTTNEWMLLGIAFLVSLILFPVFWRLTNKAEKDPDRQKPGALVDLIYAGYLIYTIAFSQVLFWIPLIIIGNIFGFLPLC